LTRIHFSHHLLFCLNLLSQERRRLSRGFSFEKAAVGGAVVIQIPLRKYNKTAAMTATSAIGESPLFFIDYLMRFLRVAVLLSIWRILLAGKGVVSGMTLASVLTYTLISEVFAEPLQCRTWLESAFWDGTIATRFLRPIGVFAQFAAEMV